MALRALLALTVPAEPPLGPHPTLAHGPGHRSSSAQVISPCPSDTTAVPDPIPVSDPIFC